MILIPRGGGGGAPKMSVCISANPPGEKELLGKVHLGREADMSCPLTLRALRSIES